MEENKEFDEKLLLINRKILSDNKEEYLESIQEFNNLLNNEIVKKYIIDENNERLEKLGNNHKTLKKELEEENKNLNTKNSEKIILQKMFSKSVENNLVGIFKYIIENHRQKIDINEKLGSYKNRYLVSIACENQEDEIFKILLSDAEINLDILDTEGYNNIFIKACKKGKLDYVKLILEKTKKQNKKIDININNDEPLRNACLLGNIKLVEYLLSLDGIKIDLEDNRKNTIFMSACCNKNKDYKCVELLYKEYKKRGKKFDINKTNLENKTAIHIACLLGNTELVKYLLSIPGINDNIKNFNFLDDGYCSNDNLEIVQLLYNRYSNEMNNKNESIINNFFFGAVKNRDVKTVEFFISKIDIKDKINFNNEKYFEIFTNIFLNNDIKIAELLYNEFFDKININVINSCSDTSLYSACRKGNFEIVEFLLSKEWKDGIDINIINKDGESPFIIACKKGYFNIAKMLYSRSGFDKEKNSFDNNKETDWIKYFEKNVDLIDESKGLFFNQIRKFRRYENLKENNINYMVITDVAYNIDDINKEKKLYEIKYDKFGINNYPKTIVFFIKNKTFNAIITEKANIEFNFDGFNNEINSEDFEKEINKILNSFKNVNNFDTYISWLPLVLIQFKKEEKEKNQNKIVSDNEIEFICIWHNMKKVKVVIDDRLKNEKNKILICDFSFSHEELEIEDDDNSGHAIPLVIFNSKDSNGNPKTKILAFNTGFNSKKAFKKLQKNLGNNVEIIKIDKDLYQKSGSCNLAPKPMIEALFSLFIDELKEGESLVNKLDQYSQDMVIANKLAQLKNEHNILNKMGSIFFNILEKINIMKSAQDLKKIEETKNTELTNSTSKIENPSEEQKIENKEEILRGVNLEEYLERLKKYKIINERLTENYRILYSNKNWFNSEWPLNENLDKTIKEIEKSKMENDFKNNPLDYIY